MGLKYYEDGKKFNYTLNTEGTIGTITEVSAVTVIDGIEYPILDNAPEPFVYGVKTICTMYYGDKCDLYDVLTGEVLKGVPFKGKAWIEEIYTSLSTLPEEHKTVPPEYGDTIMLDKEATNE